MYLIASPFRTVICLVQVVLDPISRRLLKHIGKRAIFIGIFFTSSHMVNFLWAWVYIVLYILILTLEISWTLFLKPLAIDNILNTSLSTPFRSYGNRRWKTPGRSAHTRCRKSPHLQIRSSACGLGMDVFISHQIFIRRPVLTNIDDLAQICVFLNMGVIYCSFIHFIHCK